MRCRHIFLLLIFCCFTAFISCTKTGSSKGGSGVPTSYDVAGTGNSSSTGDSLNPAGVLTAGEWNDNDHWDFWLNLMANDTFSIAQQAWGFNCTTRWNFMVTDDNGDPVTDAVVTIKQEDNSVYWVCHTNRFGVAHFLPVYAAKQPVAKLTWQVAYNGTGYNTGYFPENAGNINCKLPVGATKKDAVDIMLVVDATGSMSDEIGYLKAELYDVLNRTQTQLNYADLRYAAVFYRDYNSGDEYVTRPHGFTSNKSEIVQFVKEQSADGGGDFPEAVDKALEVALQQQWRTNATARIMFMILDAPPHDTPESLALVQASIQKAAEKGITIIPIGASGIDKPAEFLLRFMAITTNGTYTFLTNDSGIGNEHITPTVGPYTVEYLNNLMVRLITKYAGR